MSTAARIDELRKKFDENPRRYFAPLANEYRKAGDLAQAIALCREHLPKQPGHMSGHIVFGQALYEGGELAEARTVFESALALDPENLIALRHLGDIAKATGDAAAARRWYERVLDADPRNDDIAAQLATLSTGMTPASVPSVTPRAASPSVTTPTAAIATPDATMRAVDFDSVNANLARFTPFDLDAIEASAPRAQGAQPATTAEDAALAEPAEAIAGVEPAVTAPVAAGPPPTADDRVPAAADLSTASEHEAEDATPRTEAVATPTEAFATEDGQVVAEHAADVQADVQARVQADVGHEDAVADVGREEDVHATHDGDVRAGETSPLGARDIDVTEFDAPEFDATQLDVEHAQRDSAAPETHDAPVRVDAVHDEAGHGDFDEFEEGILAPEWPDTSDLVARLATPRSATPLGTPTRVPSVPAEGADAPAHRAMHADTLDAFGRAPHEREYGMPDPEPAVSLEGDAPDRTAEREQGAPEAAAAATAEAGEPEAHVAAAEPALRPSHDIATSTLPDVAESQHDPETSAGSLPQHEATYESNAMPDADAGAVAPGSPAVDDETSFAGVLSSDDESFVEHPVESELDQAVFAGVEHSPVHETDTEAAEHEPRPSRDAEQATDDVERVREAPTLAGPAFVTETMGELLVSQGFTERAVTVYEELVRRRPYDPVLSSRLQELRERVAASHEAASHDAATAVASSDPGYAPGEQRTSIADDPPHSAMPHAPTSHASPVAQPTPRHGTPAHGAARQPTPDHVSPPFVPSVPEPRERASVPTARELFARLASRRVPRRTPPHAAPAVAAARTQDEGLSALFGGASLTQDDAAARALADAFAPISAEELAAGQALDFDFARALAASPTPAATEAETPAMTPPAPDAPETAPGAGRAGPFSFDRFFPDPATREPTPPRSTGATSAVTSEPARSAPDAPSSHAGSAPSSTSSSSVTGAADDLAQFSAWLKGLGKP